MELQNRIQLTRIGNMLRYFARTTDLFGVTKANKLLYYSDCEHMIAYGRVITQDTYEKLPQGPVPSRTYGHLNAVLELCCSESGEIPDDTGTFDEFMLQFISIEKETLGNGMIRHTIHAKGEFEPKWFSKSECTILEKVARKYKHTSARELSEQTHREEPYKQAPACGEIDLLLYAKDRVTPEQLQEIRYIADTEKAMRANYHA